MARGILTARELEVAHLAAAGLTVAEIAERLSVGQNTVKKHLEHIYEKCGVRNRVELLRFLENHPNG